MPRVYTPACLHALLKLQAECALGDCLVRPLRQLSEEDLAVDLQTQTRHGHLAHAHNMSRHDWGMAGGDVAALAGAMEITCYAYRHNERDLSMKGDQG